MDSAPQHANALSVPVTELTKPRKQFSAVITQGFSVILIGLIVGGVITAALWFLPYTRVVINSQPASPTILVQSARLAKDGFIVLYAITESGSQIVGLSTRLQSGYYRNFIIPISRESVYPEGVRSFVMRVFVDDGDLVFDEIIDTPVKTWSGVIYQKRFWFLYPDRSFRQWYRIFISNPLSVLGDMIIP
jgi:hypothetical protein